MMAAGMPRLRKFAHGLLLMLAAVVVPVPASAQYFDPDEARPLTGVLKRVRDSGMVRIGYRESAVPFSYRSAHGQPFGYSIDLCLAIVDDIAETIGRPGLRIEYRPVGLTDRIEKVAAGDIDLECGSTTNTASRRERVAFSPTTFIAGTQLLVRRGSRIRSLRDAAGQIVVVARGTANEEAMRHLAATSARGFRLQVADDYQAALAMLASGAAAALAADDVLLYAYVAEHGLRREYAIVGELLSYEPYGIVYARGDAAMDRVVRSTFHRLAASREIRVIYNRWFLRPLPSGITLGIPMSPQLERTLQMLGLPVD
jgi:glutamate/aspartate transport system substrate-binding protein